MIVDIILEDKADILISCAPPEAPILLKWPGRTVGIIIIINNSIN